jgi:O-antigen/teichoic acid export membrane protein
LSSLKARTVRNVSYIGASQVTVLLLTILTVTVLARILTPSDFGIVSLGMIFMALFSSIQDFGVMQAAVQRDTRIEESISVGLALRWIIAVILAALVIGLSSSIADFYGNAAISLVLVVLSVNLFVQPVAFSSQVLLTRRLRFSSIAMASIAQYVVITVVSIVLALLGLSYWSLVIGSLSGSVALVLVLRYYENSVFRPSMDIKLAKELLGFGQHLLVTALMVFVIFNIDQLVVGKVLGVVALGIYFMAVKFGRTIGEQISGTVNRVLFPTMARIKDSIQLLETAYVQSLRMIAMITIPLCVGISALSPLFVQAVLGEGWLEASIPIAILSFQGLLNALIAPAANVLVSIGKPKYMSVQSTVQAALMTAAVYPVAAQWGINGVCVLTTTLSLGVMAYFMLVFSNVFKVGSAQMIRPMAPALASGLVTYVLLFTSVRLVGTSLFWLASMSALGAAVYLVCLHMFSGGKDVRDLIDLLRGTFLQRLMP